MIIPDRFVNKYGLPSNEVDIKYTENFAEFQEKKKKRMRRPNFVH